MTRHPNRREFLQQSGLAALAMAVAPPLSAGAAGEQDTDKEIPWYQRVLRWGQTNITEPDPERYDIAWWRGHWKRTYTQGVVVNAGGIFAYYPSAVPYHKPARALGGRDLFGELCRAAHEDGLAVFARMDSNRAHRELYVAHPEWFAIDKSGQPYKAGDLFITCINGPYYSEQIPAILREIIEKYRPEGFTDNSWSGLGRGSICYCQNCRTKFKAFSGEDLPAGRDWNSPVYRKWIQWNYARRLEVWDLNNTVTTSAGGPTCIWVGMTSGSISGQGQTFRDYREICKRAQMIMLDHQARSDSSGFQHNGEIAKLIHGLLGWDKIIPESMAMYQAGRPTFRLSSKPVAEARMWMLEGIAGGLQPWWHHVGAYHEDRRMYRTAETVYRWHKENEKYLLHRQPIATVGVVWSQQNTDFFGRDDADLLVDLPWRGFTQALVRRRIPYLPVHADDIGRYAPQMAALVLPNVAALSDSQLEAVRQFVRNGGGLIATGRSSLLNEWGDPRPDYGLADLFGAHTVGPALDEAKQAGETLHTYLRLKPELRASVDGPKTGNEPPRAGERHAVLAGFGETDILPFGGTLGALKVDAPAEVLMTLVPQFPIYPPETSWMREPVTDVPGLIVNTVGGNGRVAFLPADLDRRFGRDNLPDHGNLLANLVLWAAKDRIPLIVTGAGLVDCHLYRQGKRVILHIVNLTSAGTWRQPVHEFIPIGPLEVQLNSPLEVKGKQARLLVSNNSLPVQQRDTSAVVVVPSIIDHEALVFGPESD